MRKMLFFNVIDLGKLLLCNYKYKDNFFLTLPMLRLLTSKAQKCKTCLVGIHGIALTEYTEISTHVPGNFSGFCLNLYWPN